MKSVEDIAAKILRIPTLESRGHDNLDFHEVSVWEIKAALETAYALGAKTSSLSEPKEGSS